MVPGVLRTPPVPVTELLGSLLGLFRVGGHWRGGRGGSGRLGSAILPAPVLGELPVLHLIVPGLVSMTTLRAESPSTVLRATCPKVFKLMFLHSKMTRTSILLTKPKA